MPAKNNQETLVLALSILVTGSLLVGGGWFLTKSNFFARQENTTQKQGNNTANHPQAKVTLTALGDTFSGYSTLRSSAFQG